MLQNLTHSRRISTRCHSLYFAGLVDGREFGGGFGFDCDERGVVDVAALTPCARANYDGVRAVAGTDQPFNGVLYVAPRIESWTNSYIEPATGKCHCGRTVVLDGGPPMYDTQCDCGQLYNLSGQELRPVHEWFGEDGRTDDTGETFADIYGPAEAGY